MKFKAVIIESVEADNNNIIVYFEGDKEKQHFEIECAFDAFNLGMRKWEVWELNLKFRSEIFEDPKTGKKSYFINFVCNIANSIHEMGRK